MASRLAAAEAQIDAFRSAGKWEDVSKSFKQLEKNFDTSVTSPSHPTPQQVMAYRSCIAGELAAHKKRYDEARKHYCKALAVAPSYPDALILLAMANIEAGIWPADSAAKAPNKGMGTALKASLALKDLKLPAPMWKRDKDVEKRDRDAAAVADTPIPAPAGSLLSPVAALPFSDTDVIQLLSRARAGATSGLESISQYRLQLRLAGLYLLCTLHEQGFPPAVVSSTADITTTVSNSRAVHITTIRSTRAALRTVASADENRKNGFACVLNGRLTSAAVCLLAAMSSAESTWKVLTELIDKRFGGTADSSGSYGTASGPTTPSMGRVDGPTWGSDGVRSLRCHDVESCVVDELVRAATDDSGDLPVVDVPLQCSFSICQVYYDSAISAYAVSDPAVHRQRLQVASNFVASEDVNMVLLEGSAKANQISTNRTAMRGVRTPEVQGFGPRHLLRIDAKSRETAVACICRIPILLHKMGDLNAALRAYRACLEWNGPLAQVANGAIKDTLVEGLMALLNEGCGSGTGFFPGKAIGDAPQSAGADAIDDNATPAGLPPWAFAHTPSPSFVAGNNGLLISEANSAATGNPEDALDRTLAKFGLDFTGPLVTCFAAAWAFASPVHRSCIVSSRTASQTGATHTPASTLSAATEVVASSLLLALARPRFRAGWAAAAYGMGMQLLLTGVGGSDSSTFLGANDIPRSQEGSGFALPQPATTARILPALATTTSDAWQGHLSPLCQAFFAAIAEAVSISAESLDVVDSAATKEEVALEKMTDTARDAPLSAETSVEVANPASESKDEVKDVAIAMDKGTMPLMGPYIPDSVLLLMAARVLLVRCSSPANAVRYAAQAVVACGKHLRHINSTFDMDIFFPAVLIPPSKTLAAHSVAAWRIQHIAECYAMLGIGLISLSRVGTSYGCDLGTPTGSRTLPALACNVRQAGRLVRKAIACFQRAITLVATKASELSDEITGKILDVEGADSPLEGMPLKPASNSADENLSDVSFTDEASCSNVSVADSDQEDLGDADDVNDIAEDKILNTLIPALDVHVDADFVPPALLPQHWPLMYHLGLLYCTAGTYILARRCAAIAIELSDSHVNDRAEQGELHAMPWVLSAVAMSISSEHTEAAGILYAALQRFPNNIYLRLLEARCAEILTYGFEFCNDVASRPAREEEAELEQAMHRVTVQASLGELLEMYQRVAASAEAACFTALAASASCNPTRGSSVYMGGHASALESPELMQAKAAVERAPPSILSFAVYAYLQIVRVACGVREYSVAYASLASAEALLAAFEASGRPQYVQDSTGDLSALGNMSRVWSHDGSSPTPLPGPCVPEPRGVTVSCYAGLRAELHYGAGIILEATGQPLSAETEYAASLTLNSEHVGALTRLAELSLSAALGRSAAVCEVPQPVYMELEHADAMRTPDQTDLDRALSFANAALRSSPTSPSAWLTYSRIQSARRDAPEAAAASIHALNYSAASPLIPVTLVPWLSFMWTGL